MTQKDLFGKDQVIREKKEMETKITPTKCKLCDIEAPQAPEGNAPADVWSTLENKLTQMET
jgi:hypothetical protein